MSEKRWVQHISGQGEKWELCDMQQSPNWRAWVAPHKERDGGLLYLPKSEYRLCPGPEVWRDVTEECTASTSAALAVHHLDKLCTHGGVMYPSVYRFRKVRIELWREDRAFWAFIVEQKVPQ